MSRVTRREWYERVNGEWPNVVPELTAEEAIRAGRKLYRFVRGRAFAGKVKITSGNRYTWIRRGEMLVNPMQGWKTLVHLLSHYLCSEPHGGVHARLERRMIREVKRRGWLEGALRRPEKIAPERDVRAERHQRVLDRIAAWEAKQKRAERALAKLRRQLRYYERVVA